MKDYYSFHPRSVMTLGGGFSPTALASAKARAIAFKRYPAESGALKTETDVYLVRNSTQLKQTMHVDLSVDVSYLAFGGSASFSYDDTYAFDADSVTVVAFMRTEYGRLTMEPGASLTAPAQKLIDEGKMQAFADAYGSDFVVMERRGAAVYVLITVSNVSAATQSKISGGIEGHGGWGPLKASAKVHMQSEMMRAQKEGRINVQVAATGGDGFSGLSDMIKGLAGQADSFANIMNGIGLYLKQFNAENSAPIGFHTSSMAAFGWVSAGDNIWSEEKERRLLTLVDTYRHTQRKLARVDAILQGQDPVSQIITDDQRKNIQKARETYDAFLLATATQFESCRASKTMDGCDLPNIQLPPDNLIPVPPVPSGTWHVMQGNNMLGISESWAEISKQDNWFLNPNTPRPPWVEVYFVIKGKGVYQVDFRLDDELIRSYRYSGHEDSIILHERTQLPMVLFISDALRAGRENIAGTFNLAVHDFLGGPYRIDLLNVATEKLPDDWRLRRYDRVPYGVMGGGVQLLRLAQAFFAGGVDISRLDVAPAAAVSVRDACEKVWERNKSDCSAFVRQVAEQFGASIDGDADLILTNIANSSEWVRLGGGPEAADAAVKGKLVIGGLKGQDHEPSRQHGHVVIVVPGPLARGKYPTAYWGSLGSVGRKESTLNYAWTGSDRDDVSYYQYGKA